MHPPAIEVDGLTKRFRTTAVVNDLTFRIPAGSICGLLGNNGAGKTTTIRMVMGHLHPTAGQARTFGEDPRKHPEATLRRIAYVSETMALPRWMSVEGAIRMNAGLFPEWDHALAARLIDEFRLRRQGRFGVLSRGQKRKAILLLALCQRADLLIFDEPTSGLDVESRRRFLDCLLDVALDGNRTVLLSSHILSDIERIADRIVILQNGRLLVEGELEDLKAETRRIFVPYPVPRSVLDEHFRIYDCVVRADGTTVATVLNYSEEIFARFVSSLPPDARQALEVNGFNLEELYLTLTGSGFRRHAAGPHLSLAGKPITT